MRSLCAPLFLLIACGPTPETQRPPTNTGGTVTGVTGTGTGVTTGGTPTGPTTNPTVTVGSDVLQFYGKVPENLIFISIDTTRKDHMGPHSALGLTPFFDTIAAESMVMNDALQCSNWTWGSTTCTLAGRTNIERGHQPRLNGTTYNRVPVPEGTPFLATWLGEQGFWSGVISGNDWLSSNWGNTQGYDDERLPGGGALKVVETGLSMLNDGLGISAAERWFLHLHFLEPHASYSPEEQFIVGKEYLDPWPTDLTNRNNHYDARDDWGNMTPEDQELLEAHLRILYEGEIRTLDSRMEENWQILDDEGWLDDTLVVFWNDHGEQFFEHGHNTHAYNLYGEENDGFMWFWSKNIVPGTYDGPVASIDIVPTLLDLYGFDIPPEVTGYPIGTEPADRIRFQEALARTGGVQSAVKGDYKLHYNWFTGVVRLYDRSTDPGEQTDLYDHTDPTVLELWDALKPQVDAMAAIIIGGDPAPNYPVDLP